MTNKMRYNMCFPKQQKVKQEPTVAPPPPPEAAPEELEDAVDSNAMTIRRKKKGSKQLRRNTGTSYKGDSSGNSGGLTIN